jgi:D-galactarolactone cycloisomerase
VRIESVETIPIEIPLPRDFGGSTYHVLKRSTLITRIRTDDGLESEVYNGDNRDHAREIVRIVHDELAPLVTGEDPARIERLWDKMFRVALPIRDRKLVMEAIACVDTALWDLLGKSAGKSVWSLLGGYRASLPIISIGGYYEAGKKAAAYAKEMESLRAAGLAGCKFKVGGLAPEADAERVRAARDGAGQGFVLAADANRGWSAPDAIRFARLVEDLDIVWFEEPCHWYDDAYLMAQVRQSIRIPVNAGQSETTSHGVRRLIEAKAVDYVNFDASEAGGITEWRRAADLCAVHGVRMAHHEEPQLALQLLAAVPHGTFLECFADPDRDPVWQTLWANRPPVREGSVSVPDGPGFGLVLDRDMIERYRID